MKTGGVNIANGPLRSRPYRNFRKEELAELSLADQLLFERFGQGPLVPLPFDGIHHAFEDQALRRPDAIAALHEGREISYRELNLAADRLAIRLLDLGVQRGDCVALAIQRSIPMLIGILAALKVGAAYVPQDARITPMPVLRHVFTVTQARVVLTLSHLVPQVPVQAGQTIIVLDEFFERGRAPRPVDTRLQERRQQADASDVCFVLFTSGTTGMPNGVQVTHANVCNILLTEPGNMGMRPGLKVSQLLNIAFDMAAWEILGALAHGATLVIRGADIQKAVEQADIVIATPSVLAGVDPKRCRQVKAVAVAGEPCPKDLADTWSEFAAFYNSCGPTEVTIVNTMQRYPRREGRLSIGKPTPNNTVYILDENLKPCPIGAIGEMWAGGDCVSRGYLGNEMLTEERYRPDPFLGGERRMFRTRDLGRWTVDGELEHFGRTDDQVKIRGFRVELDSVSGAIESLPGCKQAVTLKLDSRNLVSFVRPATVNPAEARQIVAEKLPYYCTPSLVLAMDEFPTTSRGKIDKRALTILAVQRQERQVEEVTA